MRFLLQTNLSEPDSKAVSQPPKQPLHLGRPHSSAKLRILVVDDEATNRRVIKAVLHKAGMLVETLGHAHEVLPILQAGVEYNAILMDHSMPFMTGVDCAKSIRAWESSSGVPESEAAVIILLSGITACREAVLAAGMNGYMHKPINFKTFAQTLKDFFTWRALNPDGLKGEASREDIKIGDLTLRARLGHLPTARNAVPTGQTFPIRPLNSFKAFPQAPPSANQNVSPSSDRTAGTQLEALHVLLVDDEPNNNKMLCRVFAKAEMTTETCEDGDEVLPLLIKRNFSFDVIVMDQMMKRMNGSDAARKVRTYEKQHKLSPIPILALSANSSPSDHKMYSEAGMDGSLSKPVHVRDFAATIASAVEMIRCDRKGISVKDRKIGNITLFWGV